MSNNNNNAANDISHARSGQRIDGESQRPSTGAKPAASRGNVASNLESILRMLKEAGEMVLNIPYIKGITGIMLEILKVKDEVVMFKEKWQDVMTDIEQIRSIIEHFGSSSDANDGHQRDNALFITMHNTLRSFEIVLKNVTKNLIRCCATHDSSNLVTKTLQRHELYATVETCAQAVKQAWRLFDMKLNLISAEINFANNHILQQLNSKNIIEGETTQPPLTTNTSEHHSLATLVPTTPANRVRHPDIFDRSQAKADAFMTACKIFFEADPFYINNDREKILFVLSQMQRREASAWAQRYISTADFSGSLSWNKFQGQFKAAFGDPLKKIKAYKALTGGECQQRNRTIREYNLHFNTLKYQAEHTDDFMLCLYYQQGLRPEYEEGIVLRHWIRFYSTKIDTLEGWQKEALEWEEVHLEVMLSEEGKRNVKSYKQGSQRGRGNTTNERGRGRKYRYNV